MKHEKQELVTVEPTEDEKNKLINYFEWLDIEPTSKVFDLNIPYLIPLGSAVATGMLYVRDPVENSYTDGVVSGSVDGTYHLDRNNGDASVYDPSKALFRVDLHIDFNNKTLSGRFCSRSNKFPFPWRCDGWIILATW